MQKSPQLFGLRLEQLAQVRLEQIVRHAETVARVEHLFGRKKQYSQSRLQIGPVGLARSEKGCIGRTLSPRAVGHKRTLRIRPPGS